MKKVLTVLGARPQFIKAAAVSPVLRRYFRECIVHTGQHFDVQMSDVFFRELEIPKPNYNLKISGGSHAQQVGRMMMALDPLVEQEKPDIILLYGDTNSTLAGALIASKRRTCTAHIEAGLRSFDHCMPEEINRLLVDRVSQFLFAPTKEAVRNLKRAGRVHDTYLVGDVMFDILKKTIAALKTCPKTLLDTYGLQEKQYHLLTLHRQHNIDQRKTLRLILEQLEGTGETFVFPVHPRTQQALQEAIFDNTLRAFGKRLIRIEPVGYYDFLVLLRDAKRVITDSGGVQKEAYLLRVPCLTLRPSTEWVETVTEGWNRLVDVQQESIREAMKPFKPKKRLKPLYGDGTAGAKIVDVLLHVDT